MDSNSDQKSNWKLGILYFNPENKKIFVPKRLGIGWTLNFARWQSLLFILILLTAIGYSVIKGIK